MLNAKRGFTLVELMVTLVIAAILLSFAVPSFRNLLQNNRAVAMSTNFLSSFYYARSEAIKRGTPVTVCAASDATQTACSSTASWTNGWLIFVDPNADGVIANAADALRVQQSLSPGTTVTTVQIRVTFNGNGFISTGSGAFTMAATGCTGNNGRIITISGSGRIRVASTSC